MILPVISVTITVWFLAKSLNAIIAFDSVGLGYNLMLFAISNLLMKVYKKCDETLI
jgi:hypothetical protein